MIHLGQMNSHPQKTTMKDLCQTCVSFQNCVRICACPVQTDRRQGDGEAATSCASSQIAQSLTNWVERMRRTYLLLLI